MIEASVDALAAAYWQVQAKMREFLKALAERKAALNVKA